MIDWKWILVIVFILIVFTRVRVKKRGYFWTKKDGTKISFKEFLGQWKDGVRGVTPKQQALISLWSFIPLYGGLLWGIGVTFVAGTYWMAIILCATLPITSMQVVSLLQKYWAIKKVEEVMKELK